MRNEKLTQDEIDALLSISEHEDENGPSTNQKDAHVSNYLSSIEEDTIGEIGNISIGSSATTLSTLLNQKVEITTPEVAIIHKEELREEFSFDHVKVQVSYVEGFIGENVFVIKSEDAVIISDIMLGGDGTDPDEELNDIHLSAVQEAMNQMMGAAATSMSTIFDKLVNISPPTIERGMVKKLKKTIENTVEKTLVKVSFQLKVGSLIDSHIMQLIPLPFAYELVEQLLNTSVVEDNQVHEANVKQRKQTIEQEQEATNNQIALDDTQYIGTPIDKEKSIVQQANFSEFTQVELNKNEQRNLDMLLDIPLNVTVELGRTNRAIKDILELSSGSIIELDRLAGEPVDILVNKKLIAQGEVVVIDEKFGVRVTDIISKTARLMKLN